MSESAQALLSSRDRIEVLTFTHEMVCQFLANFRDISVAEMEFSPMQRFQMADQLLKVGGDSLRSQLRDALQGYECGAILADYTESLGNLSDDDILKLLTAIAYTFGTCNHDYVAGSYYYKFTVTSDTAFRTPLNNPLKDMHMHTDGCFALGFSDFVLMAKFEEQDIGGGDTKLIHVSDIEGIDHILSSPLAWRKYLYKGRAAHNVSEGIYRQLFWKTGDDVRINFNTATVFPRTLEEARFINQVHDQINQSSQLAVFKLLPGQCLILNNTNWIHGRTKFTDLCDTSRRTLIRMRGSLQSRCFEQESKSFADSVG